MRHNAKDGATSIGTFTLCNLFSADSRGAVSIPYCANKAAAPSLSPCAWIVKILRLKLSTADRTCHTFECQMWNAISIAMNGSTISSRFLSHAAMRWRILIACDKHSWGRPHVSKYLIHTSIKWYNDQMRIPHLWEVYGKAPILELLKAPMRQDPIELHRLALPTIHN